MSEKLDLNSVMDILKKIESICKKGYSIEYMVVDQIGNGFEDMVERGLIPAVTYTVYVIRIVDGEQLFSESYDHIEDCLKAGIEYVENNIE